MVIFFLTAAIPAFGNASFQLKLYFEVSTSFKLRLVGTSYEASACAHFEVGEHFDLRSSFKVGTNIKVSTSSAFTALNKF